MDEIERLERMDGWMDGRTDGRMDGCELEMSPSCSIPKPGQRLPYG